VKNFDAPVLHIIIFIDDATDLFQAKKWAPLLQLILRNRQSNCTYFFSIHNFTKNTMPMTLKKNLRSLWYFGGYTELDIRTSFPQLKAPIPYKEFIAVYKKLGKRDAVYFDYTEDGTVLHVLRLDCCNKCK
jgi:hypothetical protein